MPGPGISVSDEEKLNGAILLFLHHGLGASCSLVTSSCEVTTHSACCLIYVSVEHCEDKENFVIYMLCSKLSSVIIISICRTTVLDCCHRTNVS